MKSEQSLEELLRLSLRLVDGDSRPNINRLTEFLRNFPAISLNLKVFGYELARTMASERLKPTTGSATKVGLRSKPSTQADIESGWVSYWMSRLQAPVVYHRKIWELCYVLQALHDHDLIRAGVRGLGFGCGEEPIPSLLASEGLSVMVTDLAPDDQRVNAWRDTGQHTGNLDVSFRPYLVSKDAFDQNVSLRYVDMNAIPSDLRGFDFCWSICALEHLGSIARGLDFIENSLDCVSPGGLAIHTTEFNFTNDSETIDNWGTVLFQRAHFSQIADRLRAKGCEVDELDFDVGTLPLDRFIDLPPWPHDAPPHLSQYYNSDCPAHIKLSLDGFPSTCFGLIVRKPR